MMEITKSRTNSFSAGTPATKPPRPIIHIPGMKNCIIYEKKVKTVQDVVTELMGLNMDAKVEAADFPERNRPLMTIWKDEHTGKISIQIGE